MEIFEIIKELEYYRGYYPDIALNEVVARKEELIPELIKQLDWITKHISVTFNNKKYIGHFMIFLLLAQFEEKRAFPYIVEYFTKFKNGCLDISNSFLSSELKKVISSCFDGNLQLLESVVLDRNVHEKVRIAFLMSLLTLFRYDIIEQDYLLRRLKFFFDNLERKPSSLWRIMIIICAAWEIEELLPEIKKAYEDDLIDKNCYPPEKMIPMITSEEVSFYVLPGLTRFDKEICDTSWWRDICDNYDYDDDAYSEYDDIEEENQDMNSSIPDNTVSQVIVNNNGLPVVNISPKIGRNDPCPCGSGKKFKKCCGSINE
ncbi:MAG: DUF1186 domain-containing protein [Candidatus Cloacimonetes bacterium]|nr:DUF1186 domain-containing protein [Candidatus Cloacimonadota bacterium]